MSFRISVQLENLWHWSSLILACLGVVGALVSFLATAQYDLSGQITRSNVLARDAEMLREQAERTQREVAERNQRIAELNSIVTKIESLSDDSKARAAVATFDERLRAMAAQMKKIEDAGFTNVGEKISALEGKYKKLEDAVLQDAPKAVSIVLMSKEIESLKKSTDEKMIVQTASIDRLYTILFGSIFVIALSVMSQAVSAFFGSKRQKEA
jgi:Na+-transporting methylmalonyl-CoA/oxaloacetate decarboxylase gamma subunit